MSTQPGPITSAESPHPVREAPVSPEDAARFLMMHPKTVLRKAREGTLPAHPVGVNPSVETVWNWHTCSSIVFPSQISSSLSR